MADTAAHSGFHELCELIHKASGIKIDEGKRQLVKSRLQGRIRESGSASFEEYMARLKSDTTGQETSILVDLISTNVTNFFREQHHFDHLVHTALKDHQNKERPEMMRIWSSACSSGQEPYSIAMSLAEALGEERLRRFLILATDISTRMVRQADRGLYAGSSMTSVPSAHKDKWFDGQGDGTYRVSRFLRDRVRARHLNLLCPWPMKRSFDVIFCRNVLIYFDQPTCQRIIRRFWDQLRPGGYLYIGHSESLSQLDHRFDYVGPTVYQRPEEGAG